MGESTDKNQQKRPVTIATNLKADSDGNNRKFLHDLSWHIDKAR